MPIESYSYADRWWIPKGSTVAVVAGFFDPEAQGQTTQQRVTYVHSFQSDVPCIVLLGPPGMGKSTEFSRAVSAAQDLGYTAQLISLRGISSYEMLASAIFDLPINKNVLTRRLVYLDSLDEAAASIPVMQQWLLRIAQRSQRFTQETRQELLLRISCRTADWSEQFEEQLRQALGKNEVEVFELPPLTRLQATNFVSSKTDRAQDFLSVLEDYNTESFASLPVTLNMLLNTYILEGPLRSQNKITIYRRGLLVTCPL